VQLLDHEVSRFAVIKTVLDRCRLPLSATAVVKQDFHIDLGSLHRETVAVTEPTDGLTIGELAERTGVQPATLRSWEIRFGFPRPQRLAAGHRRYAQRDITLVEEVLRQRSAGLSLTAAIAQAVTGHGAGDQSVFAGLRRRHPSLQPQIMRKASLLALTWAVEDEYCARSERAFLFGSFQRERFFRRSEDRWNELARTAEAVVVFADFAAPSGAAATPQQVPVPAGAPLRREWAVVCEARDYPVCLAGWEFPGQQRVSDADRRFEVLWTLDPRPVRDAAVTCARLAESFSPGLNLLDRLPAEPAPPISADLQRATGLLTRMVAYLDGRPA
jgi:MerR family transcriptional regulator, light-induced transcriptional regulator